MARPLQFASFSAGKVATEQWQVTNGYTVARFTHALLAWLHVFQVSILTASHVTIASWSTCLHKAAAAVSTGSQALEPSQSDYPGACRTILLTELGEQV